MRLLALDVGDRRIGVAMSDPDGILASPLTTIERQAKDSSLEQILRIAEENDVAEIIVGIPYLMSGRVGPQARITMDYVDKLAQRTDLPIQRVDERLSSVQAERMLRQSGVRPSENKGKIDAAAAAILLQSYLDSNRDSIR
ncbi:MAG: Holliday junction resolvase RuvX [Chloroflexi bacterium]|nr:Holliday junction resolvase RuvX [Chloroflexota bacterium]